MSEEEINNLLDIRCCIYHDELCKKAHNYILEMQDKIDKANEILSKSCFEYDNCPDNVINEIIELKEILGGKENE